MAAILRDPAAVGELKAVTSAFTFYGKQIAAGGRLAHLLASPAGFTGWLAGFMGCAACGQLSCTSGGAADVPAVPAVRRLQALAIF